MRNSWQYGHFPWEWFLYRTNSLMVLCSFIFSLTFSVSGQDRRDLLIYGITGSESGSYSSTMRRIPVQRLLLELAAAPRTAEFVDAAIKNSGTSRTDLESLGLIRKEGDSYLLNFFLMTKTDEAKLRQVAENHARSLAEAFLARRTDIEQAIKTYQIKDVDPKAVVYILLGCFALDWDGLRITAEKGYRSSPQAHANGDLYTPWAREKSDLTLKGVFWGSHNDYYSEVVFTSFGDHFSVPRYALPDLLTPGRIIRPEINISLKEKLARAIGQSLKATSQQLGRMMMAFRPGEMSLQDLSKISGLSSEEATDLLALLIELDYVEQRGNRYVTKVPVFGKQDRAMVETILGIACDVIEQWLRDNYDQIKAELSNLSPLRYGVPYASGFTQIWHYVFGLANGQLVRAGMFADPYADSRKYKGFIPVVWHPSLHPDSLKP